MLQVHGTLAGVSYKTDQHRLVFDTSEKFVPAPTFPVTAASSTGRRNTL
jgi:hypothetical protein